MHVACKYGVLKEAADPSAKTNMPSAADDLRSVATGKQG